MKNNETHTSRPYAFNDEVEYASGSVVVKTIVRKVTGSISAIALDSGEVLKGRISPFDNLIHVIDGLAEVVIDDQSIFLETLHSIIIPAHSSYSFKAHVRFKIISTVIKSGYEDVS